MSIYVTITNSGSRFTYEVTEPHKILDTIRASEAYSALVPAKAVHVRENGELLWFWFRAVDDARAEAKQRCGHSGCDGETTARCVEPGCTYQHPNMCGADPVAKTWRCGAHKFTARIYKILSVDSYGNMQHCRGLTLAEAFDAIKDTSANYQIAAEDGPVLSALGSPRTRDLNAAEAAEVGRLWVEWRKNECSRLRLRTSRE